LDKIEVEEDEDEDGGLMAAKLTHIDRYYFGFSIRICLDIFLRKTAVFKYEERGHLLLKFSLASSSVSD
jgi:hypothetical protein